MNSYHRILGRLAALTGLSIFLFALSSAAATHPLNSPQGLAVAANGNLYVANNSGNNVLVYSPAHAQIAAKTISTGIANPTALAFDQFSDLWVANAGNNSITGYSPTGVQNSTITSGISGPYWIAVDGLNNLWVNNGYESISVYETPYGQAAFTLNGAPDPLIGIFYAGVPVTGIAIAGQTLALGTNSYSVLLPIFHELVDPASPVVFPAVVSLNETCFAPAFDSLGNLYCANQDGSLTFYPLNGRTAKTVVAKMGFFPFGIAIDNARGFIYVSNAIGNSIAVYNTSGTLLTTIQ